MKFRYNYEKNAKLLAERGIGFDEIIGAINNGGLLSIAHHYNKKKYPNQKILYVQILDEVVVVPCIQENDNTIFLKTLFASRKARKLFMK